MEVRTIAAIILIAFVFIFLLIRHQKKKQLFSTRLIVRTAIFAAIAIILYLVPIFNISLPIFPEFLKLHFDEVPAFIAGFAYGPLSASIVIVVRTIAKLPMTITGGVGELCDLLYSLVFVIPAAFIYRRKRNLAGASIGFTVGFFVQLIFASLVTSFVILDFYIFVMGLSKETIIAMCQAINPNVTSLGWTFFFLVALPFNALKNAAVIIVTFILYKRIHIVIDKIKN